MVEVHPLVKLTTELLAEAVAHAPTNAMRYRMNARELLEKYDYGDVDDKARELIGGILGLAAHFVYRYADAVGVAPIEVMDALLMTVAAQEVRGSE
jgi:hypothetical protein